jgi:hypothetical protein
VNGGVKLGLLFSPNGKFVVTLVDDDELKNNVEVTVLLERAKPGKEKLTLAEIQKFN